MARGWGPVSISASASYHVSDSATSSQATARNQSNELTRKASSRVKKEHKLYPGYLMVEVEYNDRILYLFRETSGVGDFVGHTIVGGVTRPPTPMTDREVERMLLKDKRGSDETGPAPVITKAKFDRGDRLRVNDGTFAGMEGEVKEINQEKGLVKLQVSIFGRPVDVDLEFWQVEKV